MKVDNFEHQYAEALENVLENGIQTPDRTGKGRIRVSGQTFAFPSYTVLPNNEIAPVLPVLLGKRVFPKMAIKEMVWMLSGMTNVNFLRENNVTYWDEWADENGELGPVYGHQFRNFNGFDQLAYVAKNLRSNWTSTQMLINLWNGADLSKMALPPCHFSYFFQALAEENDERPTLHIHLTQRSADSFLGVPYNAIMATFFLHVMAKYAGMKPGNVYWTLHDFHIYNNHVEQVHEYLNNFEEDKYGTIGEGMEYVFDEHSNNLLTQIDVKNPVRPLDEFFAYCVEQKFANISIFSPVGSYGVIAAEIAV